MTDRTIHYDVIIIGAGAAGLMCAIEAGKRGRRVLVVDHANKPGKKILIAGGGRCNFTNLYASPENYLSANPHFCKSALNRYTQHDFISLVEQHAIPYHEKTLGQLFCDNKSKDILTMLLTECAKAKVTIRLNTTVNEVKQATDNQFCLVTQDEKLFCDSLVIATGGLSFPTMGASPFGYKIAEQFGINVLPVRAGLVPFTLHQQDKQQLETLSGISVNAVVKNARQQFREAILFTHRGLSGPAILQISSYWLPGEEVVINLTANINLLETLLEAKQHMPKKQLKTILNQFLPRRVNEVFLTDSELNKTLHELAITDIEKLVIKLQQWHVKPNATEGYRTAEVTIGGVDCNELSSKTMQANKVSGLYFIGEVVDVTGWLGGYNFQWAWSSGWAAGQVV